MATLSERNQVRIELVSGKVGTDEGKPKHELLHSPCLGESMSNLASWIEQRERTPLEVSAEMAGSKPWLCYGPEHER